MKIKFHPWCELFNGEPMSEEELDALAKDIKQEGQKFPILTFEGAILDGRNRYLACQRAGVPPEFKAIAVKTKDGKPTDTKAIVRSMNLLRRHLSTAQRAMIAAKLAGKKAGRPTDNRSEFPTITNADAAKMLKVSEDSVDEAKKILAHAVEPVQAAVEAGDVSLHAAAAVAELPKREQLATARNGPEGMRELFAPLASAVPPKPKKTPKRNGHAKPADKAKPSQPNDTRAKTEASLSAYDEWQDAQAGRWQKDFGARAWRAYNEQVFAILREVRGWWEARIKSEAGF